MSEANSLNLSLWSRGMLALLLAQFLSALADNAVLVVAIAILKGLALAKWVPALQESFVVPFILLAPFVGHIADRFPKGRVMLWANAAKFAGAALMAAGMNPFLSYCFIGVGASVYSPAKYGILTQMFAREKLVRANGLLEGSTIVAILMGVLLGGWLTDHSMHWAFAVVIGSYVLAAGANLLIPRLPPEKTEQDLSAGALVLRFGGALRKLFGDRDARFSLLGTSMFWASGSTLRMLLFAWVPLALGLMDNQTPANLMGAVSIGIVGGALAAGLWVSLPTVNRALLGGVLLGPLILAMNGVGSFATTAVVMVGIGAAGGFFVVPLNALLQERGHGSVGAGTALAVQNFFENIAMLLFVGGYLLANWAGISVSAVLAAFGGLILVAVSLLVLSRRRGAAVAQGRLS